jgi:anaerobic selenocysteine-containing dehydrogenase
MEVRKHVCPLCEAGCGLQSTVDGGAVAAVRGNPDHVASRGHVCPKAFGLTELHNDPDRVKTPLLRASNGRLEPATWEAAFKFIDQRLMTIIDRDGADAVAFYLGNPVAHDFATTLYASAAVRLLGSRNYYTANTVDAMPKFVSCQLMFGGMYTVPLPDVDRCSYLLILGANPLVSNGSLLTAPGMGARMRELRRRGGRVVVIDPNRTQTAREADEHHRIRPGTDALLLLALVYVLFDENLTNVGPLRPYVCGIEDVQAVARDFSPESVAAQCGIAAADIRRLARDLAAAPTAAVYGRTGTCTQRFGTVSSWLIDVLNTLTGNLDRPGGAMFASPAADLRMVAAQRGAALGRWHSRVRGAPEVLGELPLACLAEEIDTPGTGQVKALITVAGNPARSAPDSARLTAALDQLELMVSLDLYRNETTRHAHVVLPAPSPLTKPHYDLFFGHFAIRNTATYSAPVLPWGPDEKPDWQSLLRLIGIIARQGSGADLDAIDDMVADSIAHAVSAGGGGQSSPEGSGTQGLRGPERLLDLLLQAGPHRIDGESLTLAKLREHPNGLDFGPLTPRLPGVLNTPSGQVELAPAAFLDDVANLREGLRSSSAPDMVLIGRRHLRSNNSWMHNLPTLAKGPDRCTLQVHPADVERLKLGQYARISSAAGVIEAPVQATDAVSPGVVSLPHGWGHDEPGTAAGVATRQPGVNSNVLASGNELDPLSGTAVLNGIPVQITASLHPTLASTNGDRS